MIPISVLEEKSRQTAGTPAARNEATGQAGVMYRVYFLQKPGEGGSVLIGNVLLFVRVQAELGPGNKRDGQHGSGDPGWFGQMVGGRIEPVKRGGEQKHR